MTDHVGHRMHAFLWPLGDCTPGNKQPTMSDSLEGEDVLDDVGCKIRRFLYPKGDCVCNGLPVTKDDSLSEENSLLLKSLIIATRERIFPESFQCLRGDSNPFATAFPDLEQFVRQKRCGELRAKKSPIGKLSLIDLAYIFNEYDDDVFPGNIAALVFAKNTNHPLFVQLLADLYRLDLTCDDIEINGKTIAEYLLA